MVPLDRALVSSYRLSVVTMSLTAAFWPQFAMQVFRRGIGRLTCIGSYVSKQVTTFTFRAQATTFSKHHTRTVMDAGSSVHHEYGRLTLPNGHTTLLRRRYNVDIPSRRRIDVVSTSKQRSVPIG